MSCAVLTLIVGQIFLNIMAPPYSVNPAKQTDSSSALYILIQIATPIIAIIYLFFMAFDDRRKEPCNNLSSSRGVEFIEKLDLKL